MDIAFGDGIAVGGYHCALVLFYHATRYKWVFGLNPLHFSNIISAFSSFRAEDGALAHSFRCNCNEKLFGYYIKQYLLPWNSDIIATAVACQSSTSLVK